jgi:hypothetical protein
VVHNIRGGLGSGIGFSFCPSVLIQERVRCFVVYLEVD